MVIHLRSPPSVYPPQLDSRVHARQRARSSDHERILNRQKGMSVSSSAMTADGFFKCALPRTLGKRRSKAACRILRAFECPLKGDQACRSRRLVRTEPGLASANFAHDPLRSLHSITSLARSSRIAGTASPKVLAVLGLTIRSILVGNSIGRSPGAAPLRILST